MKVEEKRDRSSAYIKDEDGILRRDVELIHGRWVRGFHTLPERQSPKKLDPNIAKGLDQRPENMPQEVKPTTQELTAAIRSLANGKADGPDEISVELFKIPLNSDPTL